MVTTFKVLQYRLPEVQEKVAKLAKRATKLGLEPLRVVPVGEPFSAKDKNNATQIYQQVELVGQPPVLPGWRLQAVINVLDGEGIIKSLPGTQLPESFRKLDAQWCDHCKTRRVRNDTFVLQQVETQIYKQVGRQCLKDFLPSSSTSPESLAWFCQAIEVAETACREAEESQGGTAKHYIDLIDFLGFCSVSIRDRGWVSRKEAFEQGGCATADMAMMQLQTPGSLRTLHPNPEDNRLAHEAVEWASGLSDNQTEPSEFLHNVRTLARLGVVDGRTIGIGAAILTTYQREAAKQTSQQALKPVAERGYVGQVGHKCTVQATCLGHPVAINGQYGTSYRYQFAVDGNLVVWFASKEQQLLTGTTVQLTGKVKAQQVYQPRNGEATPQTLMTYCQIE